MDTKGMLSFPLKRTYKTMTEGLYHKIIKAFTEYFKCFKPNVQKQHTKLLGKLVRKKAEISYEKEKKCPQLKTAQYKLENLEW